MSIVAENMEASLCFFEGAKYASLLYAKIENGHLFYKRRGGWFPVRSRFGWIEKSRFKDFDNIEVKTLFRPGIGELEGQTIKVFRYCPMYLTPYRFNPEPIQQSEKEYLLAENTTLRALIEAIRVRITAAGGGDIYRDVVESEMKFYNKIKKNFYSGSSQFDIRGRPVLRRPSE